MHVYLCVYKHNLISIQNEANKSGCGPADELNMTCDVTLPTAGDQGYADEEAAVSEELSRQPQAESISKSDQDIQEEEELAIAPGILLH